GCGAPLAHMLGLRQHVEDECDRSVELSRDDDLELVRELDDRGAVPIRCHCALLRVWRPWTSATASKTSDVEARPRATMHSDIDICQQARHAHDPGVRNGARIAFSCPS